MKKGRAPEKEKYFFNIYVPITSGKRQNGPDITTHLRLGVVSGACALMRQACPAAMQPPGQLNT